MKELKVGTIVEDYQELIDLIKSTYGAVKFEDVDYETCGDTGYYITGIEGMPDKDVS